MVIEDLEKKPVEEEEIEEIVEEKPQSLKEIVQKSQSRTFFQARYDQIVEKAKELNKQHPELLSALELFKQHYRYVGLSYEYDIQFQQPMFVILISPRPLSQLEHRIVYYIQTTPLELHGFRFPTYVFLYFDSTYVTPMEIQQLQKSLRENQVVFEAIKDVVGAMAIAYREGWWMAEYHKTMNTSLINMLGTWKKGTEASSEYDFNKIKRPEAKEPQVQGLKKHIPTIAAIIASIVAAASLLIALLL